ncbi:MAG: hypothetical protein MOIL_01388 [Candidatus Methanolliviera sp. GoM_oil]|nr:MAG: hypothetical protein MOIL_01388 [Candidatus Methanolliviera sp. GoM_oil]
MMGDDRGMMTLVICLEEISFCLWPPTWLCCLPCLLIIFMPWMGVLDIVFAPLECLGRCAIGAPIFNLTIQYFTKVFYVFIK